MKGVYFWIGVLLFVASAFIFVTEHGKFYEYFDGTSTGSSTTTTTSNTDGSGNPVVPSTTATATTATATTTATTAAPTTDGSGNPIVPSTTNTSSGQPSTTTSTTMPTSGATVPQTGLAPGSTTTNPTMSVPSASDMKSLADGIEDFSYAVYKAGGKQTILGKLSPGDATYFNTLSAMIPGLGTYADPSTYPFSPAQTASKILEFQKSTKYITNQLPNDVAGSTTLQQTVAAAVLAATPLPSSAVTQPTTPGLTLANSSGSTSSAMSGSGSGATQQQSLYGGMAGLFNQNAGGIPGNQGQMPLNGQFTLNGNPTSQYIPNPTAGVIFSPTKKDGDMCDATDLQNLIEAVKMISANLKSLNTSDPTVMARISNIDSLTQDLQDMNTKIQQGSMDPSTIPIKVGDARNFLNQSTVVQAQLPALISMPGSSGALSAASVAPTTNTPNAANLLQMAQYLQGTISVNFDGSMYAREQMAKRIDNIINLLKTKQISSTDAQNILQALSSIQDQSSPGGYDNLNNSVFTSSWQPTGGMPTSPKPGYVPDSKQLAQAGYDGGQAVRPGSSSDSSSYLKRASAAYSAYNATDTAGGPDYKSMLTNLCTQVSKSGLDMGDIGCTNVQNVSPDYGYKGTYLMVCNRLKDTWGGNYPQMFGCPT